MAQKGKPKVKKVVIVVIGLYTIICGSLYFFQENIIFRPTVLSQDHIYKFSHPFQEIFLKADDGGIINAVLFKNESPKGVILYFHGNVGDLNRWGRITQYFANKNYDVLVMDYRTYGKSTGDLTETQLYNDAQMCYDYIKMNYNENSITVYGRSLGSAFATYVSSKNKPKQTILEAPFFSLEDVTQRRLFMFPAKYLLKFRFPNFEYVQNINNPLYIFHGTDDAVVPFESGKKLFNASSKINSEFILIPHGTHNNLNEYDSYKNQINELLK
ncbi:MAG TPA: alpha/beta fold hydrolase [Yeosuana sp.]